METLKLRTDLKTLLDQMYDIELNYSTLTPSRQMLMRKRLREMTKEKNKIIGKMTKAHYTYFLYTGYDGANNDWQKVIEKALKSKVPWCKENPWKVGQVQIHHK